MRKKGLELRGPILSYIQYEIVLSDIYPGNFAFMCIESLVWC